MIRILTLCVVAATMEAQTTSAKVTLHRLATAERRTTTTSNNGGA